MMNFKEGLDRHQELLMPQKIEDYIGENHLARMVCDICDCVDLSRIQAKYSEIGQHAYNPKMMMALLFYGYSVGVRSSRKLSKACEERVDFMYISQNLKPSHDRIADFRKDNLEELKEAFTEIVMIGANLGLIKIGNIKVSIDGTKIRANASAKLSKDEKELKKFLKKIREEVNVLFTEAEKIDRKEDKEYGKSKRGDETPKKLRSKKSREKAIEEAVKKVKEEKELLERNSNANESEPNKNNKEEIDNLDKLSRNLQAKSSKEMAIEKAIDVVREQKESMKEKIRQEKGREPTKAELKKIKKVKINITDHDAKFMKERNGVIKPNYNAQIAVDEKEQFIVANSVTMECNDQHQLIPMIEETKKNIETSPEKVKADNGYYSQLEAAVKRFPEIDFYVDDKNRRKEDLNLEEIKKSYDEVAYSNLKKLLSEDGMKEYKKRMHTAEPPFGNIKFNLGYRHFLLIGENKCGGEFNLMCIGHNLKKIMSFISKTGKTIYDAVKKFKPTSVHIIQPSSQRI